MRSDTVSTSIEDAIKGEATIAAGVGWLERSLERLVDWKDERIEGLARKPGGLTVAADEGQRE